MAQTWREFFDIDREIVYLNAAYLPVPLKSVIEAGQRGLAKLQKPWLISSTDFFTQTEELRALVGQLLDCSGDHIAIVPSVSYGVETAVKNLKLGAGAKILIPHDDFPSDVYPWLNAAALTGAVVKFVKRQGAQSWTDAFLSEIDKNTGVVSVPHCDWSDGRAFDLERIAAATRAVGSHFVIDASQSFPVVPLSVKKLRPDFLFSVGYKWQLGVSGTSYLYVDDKHWQGRPIENNWINRKNSENFAQLTDYQMEFQSGARRFDAGQRSRFVEVPMAISGLKFLAEIGSENLFSHCRGFCQNLQPIFERHGFHVVPETQRLGHILGVKCDDISRLPEVLMKLKSENIFVSQRGPNLRVSPHIYNDGADLEKLALVLKHIS